MKKNLLIIALISLACCNMVTAQWTNKTMSFGGLTRSYRVYKSANYNAANPASLLISLHGLGDNMNNFSGIGFNHIADTANIICIFPQAVTDALLQESAWNSGAGEFGYCPNSTVNDIGFINAIIDTAQANYSIDRTRVYLCGFSMGGFMTERMALQSNYKIAAFGSMSGTFGNGLTTHNPGRRVPVAHFHGTHDSTVYYIGDLYGLDPDSMIHFWIANNTCGLTPVTYNYPNTVPGDSITVERFEYSNGNPESDVWFFKMFGASHEVLFTPTNDISECVELWLFFRRHSFASAGIPEQTSLSELIQVYPNPASNNITIEAPQKSIIDILNIQGQLVKSLVAAGDYTTLNISSFSSGVYLMQVKTENGIVIKKFMKE